MADLSEIEKNRVVLEGPGGVDVQVNAGRLLVSQEVSTPIGATSVQRVVFSSIGSTDGVDDEYLITNGKTLTIQLLNAGAEEEIGGSIVELFEDPNGDKSVLNRINQIFVNGDTTQVNVIKDFVGDGTRRIILRRRGYTGSAREMSAKWIGFEK